MTQIDIPNDIEENTYPIYSLNKAINKFIDDEGILDDSSAIVKVTDYRITNSDFFDYLYQNYSTEDTKQEFLKRAVGYNYQDPQYKTSEYHLINAVVQRVRSQLMDEEEIDIRTVKAAKLANTKLTPQAKDVIKINLGNFTYYQIAELIYEKTGIEISASGIAQYVSNNNLPNSVDFNETKFNSVYELYQLGIPDEQIANLFGIQVRSVSLILRERFGIIRNFPWGRDPEAIIKRLSELRHQGLRYAKITDIIKTEFEIKANVTKRSLISVGYRNREEIPSEDELTKEKRARLKSQILELANSEIPRNVIRDRLGLSSGIASTLMTELRKSGELNYKLFKWDTEVEIDGKKMSADTYLKDVLLKDPIIASLSRREISSYVEGKLSSIGLDNPPSMEAIRIKVRRTLKTMTPEES